MRKQRAPFPHWSPQFSLDYMEVVYIFSKNGRSAGRS